MQYSTKECGKDMTLVFRKIHRRVKQSQSREEQRKFGVNHKNNRDKAPKKQHDIYVKIKINIQAGGKRMLDRRGNLD